MLQTLKLPIPFKLLALALIILLLTAAVIGCGETAAGPPDDEPGNDLEPEDPVDEKPVEVDYAELEVNELGQIMVLMYHQIADTEAEWVRTPDNFRKDLKNLYDAGYRLVSMNDVLDGNIDIPAGTSPVVLTFDDGTEGQFRYLPKDAADKDGELIIDPDSAVGILEEFYSEYPDFGLAATFYIFYVATPFGQSSYVAQKLEYLVDRGFEIGNHSYSHPFPGLRSLAPEAARKELAYHVKHTQQYLPGYQVRSLALPYGSHPDDMSYIIQGSYEGVSYHNEGILLVGSNPAPSPFNKSFKPAAIPRIRASEMLVEGVGMYDWMQNLKGNSNRYVSGGDPNTVVIPERLQDQVNEEALQGKELVTY